MAEGAFLCSEVEKRWGWLLGLRLMEVLSFFSEGMTTP